MSGSKPSPVRRRRAGTPVAAKRPPAAAKTPALPAPVADPAPTPAASKPAASRKPRSRATPVVAASGSGSPAAASVEPAADRLLFATALEVRWGDMDAFNHVNNARFLGYLEEARMRWLQDLPGPWLDEHTAPILAAVHINYRRPIEWPVTLRVELRAGRVGGSSLAIEHRVVDAADAGVLYSDGHVVMVWTDRRSGRGSTLPDAVRAACTG
jgi:acyl-CoA thioester hydrolase